MQWEISKKTLHAQMNNKGSHTRARERKQKEGVRISQQLRFSNNREERKSKAFTASLVPVFNPLLAHFYSALHRGIVCLLEHQLLRRLVPGKVKKIHIVTLIQGIRLYSVPKPPVSKDTSHSQSNILYLPRIINRIRNYCVTKKICFQM